VTTVVVVVAAVTVARPSRGPPPMSIEPPRFVRC